MGLSTKSYSQVLNPARLTYHQILHNEKNCLAKAIYFETFQRDELARKAVGWAVYNRKYSEIFPATICENISKPGEFPWRKITVIRDAKYYRESLETARQILDYEDIDDVTNGAIFFASALDNWFYSMVYKGKLKETAFIGGHRFYRYVEK